MQITDRALSANAITLQDAEDLQNFINSDDWDDENDMPPNIRAIYEISLQHYHHGRMH